LGAGVRAKVEPEDVLQEVSLTAYTALPRYDLQDRHPLNWLYQIAHRRIVGAYRRFCSSQKRASHREAPLYTASGRAAVEWVADESSGPEHALLRREMLERVGQLWERLSDDQRATLRMRYVEGKPFKEIGDALGKTDCAVRVLLCRTLDRLQGLLDARD
jgi:RNA polymerase sigma-70 factor (ECF subfamily)